MIKVLDGKAPSAFLSYSWDDDEHREWVKQFATRLTADGVAVTLDRWHAAPGGQIPAFMERAVRENDFVITVCTPKFKEKSDRRGGGVGYEGDIMTAEVFTGTAREKFIPVLRRGSWRDAAPSWLLGSYYIDLSADPYSEANYEDLLRTLHGAGRRHPQPGPRPDFGPRRPARPRAPPRTLDSPRRERPVRGARRATDDNGPPIASEDDPRPADHSRLARSGLDDDLRSRPAR